jgi:serine/threonine protein kinase
MKLPEPTPGALKAELRNNPIASAARSLPAGTWLDEFEVEEIIGEGSVAIVYAATDRALSVPVAIAEYMPARLAQRDEAQVTPRSSAQADLFAQGLKAFINETHALARCDHPSLVRIVRQWEANATAYRVMPRYPARRLLDVRRDMNEPPDEEALRALLDALLGALRAYHDAGGCHGKVTPSNILLLADNRPLLLGPGAAGRAIAGDPIDASMTSVEPCFAPIEQIVEADIPLHPSADLYALAGVARYWMSGQLPAPAFGSLGSARRETVADMVQRLCLTWPRLHYSASLLDALDSALSIYPAERPQSVAQMCARLGTAPRTAGGLVSAARTAAPVLNDAAPPSPAPDPAPPPPRVADLDTVMASPPDPDHLATSGVARIDDASSVGAAFARQVPNPRRVVRWSGAVLVLLALLLVGMPELLRERRAWQVLDALGISRGTDAGDSTAASASAVGPASSAGTQIAGAAGDAKPMPTEQTAADSPAGATAPASPASTPIAAAAGDAKPMPTPTESAAADSPPGAGAAGSPASAPVATVAGGAKPMATRPPAADAPAGATASASPTSPNHATLAHTAPAAVARRPASAPSPTHAAQQHSSRAPANPREACGSRTQFSLYRCMQMQCSQRQWASHPQCVRLRTTDSVD